MTIPQMSVETIAETGVEPMSGQIPETRTGKTPESSPQSSPHPIPGTGSESTTRGVLLLGATGRTGGRVLTQLLERGIPVRAIVRSAERLPAGATAAATAGTIADATVGAVPASTSDAPLTVIEADIAEMQPEQLRRHLEGCDTVISCLGHAPDLRGVYGPPRDLVEGAVRAVCEAAASLKSASPIRLILMSSVSVNRPGRADNRRGHGERAFVGLVRALVPPARDNQRAADYLAREIGEDHPFVSWVVVRPDSLVEGAPTAYLAHDELVASLFRPDRTRMANVARFMAELVQDEATWLRWRGKMPVIVDETPKESTANGTNE